MATSHDTTAVGDRYISRFQLAYPASRSDLPPLPYFPNLKLALRSVTASIVMTYLQIHCPAPLETNDRVSSAPVMIDLDQVCTDLQVSRRTLGVALCVLASWWHDERVRSCAARAGREFLNPTHTINGRIKPFSITGSKSRSPGVVLALRRNWPRLTQMLGQAGLQSLVATPSEMPLPCADSSDIPVLVPTVMFGAEKGRLAELMLRGSALAMDGRTVRYARLRSAVEAGLVSASVLKVRRNSGHQ